jgi:hypothetical protein
MAPFTLRSRGRKQVSGFRHDFRPRQNAENWAYNEALRLFEISRYFYKNGVYMMTAILRRTFSGCLNIRSVLLIGFLLLPILAGCAAAPVVVPTATQALTAAIELPSPTPQATATEEPTATATATAAATATPTTPPSATPVPDLAVLPDGFRAWCAPQEYQGVQITGPDEIPVYANLLAQNGETFQVKIPAAFCVLAYQFNQPVPAGSNLVIYNGNSPFVNLPLTPVDGQPDQGWAIVAHDYVINPPFWEITYQVAVTDPEGKELWSQPVKFAKPLPANCPFGGLPDPVTLYCRQSDPKELEPHPDVTFPAYYTIEPPED